MVTVLKLSGRLQRDSKNYLIRCQSGRIYLGRLEPGLSMTTMVFLLKTRKTVLRV